MATDQKISELTAYTTPQNTDVLPIVDTANSITKKSTWAIIKSTLKSYFDTLYPSGSGTSTGSNTGDQTITLSGDISGTGTGAITTTIGAGKVTEAMQVLADNTTQNVSSSKHGYAPKGDGTTTKFLNANGAYSVPSTTATTCVTLIPDSAITKTNGNTAITVNVNTTMNLGQVIIPFQITVNKISIYMVSTNVTGTFDLTLYSEDGQTQVIAVTTASIGTAATVFTTAVSAVVVNPGVYYIAINPNGTSDAGFAGFAASSAPFDTTNGLPANVTSEPKMQGTLAISAGVPSATFTPSSITAADAKTLIVRLDN